MKPSTTQFFKRTCGAVLALAACVSLAACAPAIQFHDAVGSGADKSGPPTEMITEKLIAAEHVQHQDQANQNLDKLLVPNPPPYMIGPGDVKRSIAIFEIGARDFERVRREPPRFVDRALRRDAYR